LIKAVSSIESLLVTRSLLQRLFFEKKLITFARTMVTLSLKPWREFFTPIWREAEKRSTEKASRILDLLGLTRVWNQPAYLLSGGQMKLVEIGRALMSDAKLLLLDEPVSGVNPTLAHEIFGRIIKLRDELGLTFFIVEHRLDIALRYVDQMFAMAMGRVTIDGKIISNLAPHEIARLGIAYLPQTESTFTQLTVAENFKMAGYTVARNDFEERKTRVLEIFPRLSSYMKTKVFHLSGGERQMVAMSMALLRKPNTIMFDEPTANLSPMLATEVLNTITFLAKDSDITILLVEQNATRALQIGHSAY